jgi:hypothetical protein
MGASRMLPVHFMATTDSLINFNEYWNTGYPKIADSLPQRRDADYAGQFR